MSFRFHHHYTRDEVRALLPRIQTWLVELVELRGGQQRFERRLGSMLAQGDDLGGETVNGWVRAWVQFHEVLREFESREILIKDLDRGLLDFPAIVQGREVFLCWELGEEDVKFWHDLDAGYAGREKI